MEGEDKKQTEEPAKIPKAAEDSIKPQAADEFVVIPPGTSVAFANEKRKNGNDSAKE